jgi:hypothetical protein
MAGFDAAQEHDSFGVRTTNHAVVYRVVVHFAIIDLANHSNVVRCQADCITRRPVPRTKAAGPFA